MTAHVHFAPSSENLIIPPSDVSSISSQNSFNESTRSDQSIGSASADCPSSSCLVRHPRYQDPASYDEGVHDMDETENADDELAQLENHRVSNVSPDLLVADANATIGSALFTKRCRLSNDNSDHQKRIVITPRMFKKINEYTVIGPNLVRDDKNQRYQIVVLNEREMNLHKELHERMTLALAAQIPHAQAMNFRIIHVGSKLIHFEKYDIFVQHEHFGTLHNHLIRSDFISEDQCKQLFRQMVGIVAYLHEIGAVLRDGSLRRWVFSDEVKTKLVLGTWVDMELLSDLDNDILQDRFGCPATMSPEVYSQMVTSAQDKWSGRAADIWSLGICLYVMATKRFPFYDGTAQGLFRKIRHGTYDFPSGKFPALTLRVKELIIDMLQMQPGRRPTASDLLKCSWLRNH